jgi:hypothetical protein
LGGTVDQRLELVEQEFLDRCRRWGEHLLGCLDDPIVKKRPKAFHHTIWNSTGLGKAIYPCAEPLRIGNAPIGDEHVHNRRVLQK